MIKKLTRTLLVFGTVILSAASLSAFTCETETFEDGSSITYCDNYYIVHSTTLPGGGCAGADSDCIGIIPWPE